MRLGILVGGILGGLGDDLEGILGGDVGGLGWISDFLMVLVAGSDFFLMGGQGGAACSSGCIWSVSSHPVSLFLSFRPSLWLSSR